jgi:hypothetical protein
MSRELRKNLVPADKADSIIAGQWQFAGPINTQGTDGNSTTSTEKEL